MTTNSPNVDIEHAKTESLNASTLSLSLTVKNLEKSIAWYSEVLGFTVERKIERDGKLHGVSLKAGNARISINQDDGAKGWDRVKGEGFAIYITTEQNIDMLASRVKSSGGTLATEPADMPWGVRMFRVKDLDGFKIAISSPRPG